MRGKSFFLTYPKCSMTKEEVLLDLKERDLEMDEYVIAEEVHEDGTPHLHVYLKLKENLEVVTTDFWDMGETKEKRYVNYHGNYQTVRSNRAVMKYCQKESNYLAMGVKIQKKTTTYEDFMTSAKEGNLEEAISKLETGGERTIRDRILYDKQLMNILKIWQPKVPHPQARNLEDFEPIFEWDRSKVLILYGETNCGKTTLAISLLPYATLTRHLDLLAREKITKEGGFIMDDMSIKHLHDEAQIAILDTAFATQIHVRYQVAEIPMDTPRIITTNKHPGDIVNIWNPAIARRIQTVQVLGIGKYEVTEPGGG